MCVDFRAANFRGQLQNPAVLKSNAAVGPEPGVPRAVAPEAAARLPIASGWKGRCARRAARGPRWRRGRWPPGTRRAAGGTWSLPVPPRPAAGVGHLGKLGAFRAAASGALGGRQASRLGRKSRAEVARLKPRTAAHLIWAKRNSSDLECKATPSGPAFLTHPHLPPPGHPTKESRRPGPEVAESKWEGVRGAPTKPRLLLTKAESPAPARGSAQQRRRQKATPTTAAPGPSP